MNHISSFAPTLAQAASAAEKAAAGEGQDGEENTNGNKRSKRRCAGQTEVTDKDYPLLQAMQHLAYGAIPTTFDVPQFVSLLAKFPQKACIAKLRRGSIKKVLTVSWLTNNYYYHFFPSD